MMKKEIVILGGGISGLTTAFWMKEANSDFILFEANSEVGGKMQTEITDEFLIDYGPNSGLDTNPHIREIIAKIGLESDFIYSNPQGIKRYILKNGELQALPMSPKSFLSTKLFSTKAKLRLLAEPFIGKSEDGYYQSIAQFVERRLGKEFLDYAIDPFVSGVFAGDPTKLSVKSAFPKLYRLEEVYGGLIKGTIKGAKERKKRGEESKQSAKMFSMKFGMQTFAKGIAKHIGENILTNSIVKSVEKWENSYKIVYLENNLEQEIVANKIISTLPAYAASKVFAKIDNELKNHLDKIFYPTVMVLFVGYEKQQIRRELDGFGFLIPTLEKKNFLGGIWSSTIFENRSNSQNAAFTIFVGGAKDQNRNWKNPTIIIEEVLSEFQKTMNIDGKPNFVRHKIWENAIPQYNLGYIEHEKYFQKFEEENKGIFLSGNYRGGISVGDCVKNSKINFERIMI